MDDIRTNSRESQLGNGDAVASTDASRGGQPMTATPTAQPITLIEAITQALAWELEHAWSVRVRGEDVGVNGGVFRATAGLQQQFGDQRVLDTPLDETTIAGLTVGMAAQGMKPVAEAQFDGTAEIAHDADARADELDGGGLDRPVEQRILAHADGGAGRAGDQIAVEVLEIDVGQADMGNVLAAGPFHHHAAHRDGHVGKALVDAVLDGGPHEVEGDRPLRQPDINGNRQNQQHGQDRHQAVRAYPSQAPQRLPVSMT